MLGLIAMFFFMLVGSFLYGSESVTEPAELIPATGADGSTRASAPPRGQNRIMLGDENSRNAHAQRASDYHWVKAYPGSGRESMRELQLTSIVIVPASP